MKVPHPVVGLTAYQIVCLRQGDVSKSIIDLAQIPQLHVQTQQVLSEMHCALHVGKLHEMNERSLWRLGFISRDHGIPGPSQ